MILMWLLVALAVFDVEHLWLPDRLIWLGIGLSLLLAMTRVTLETFLNPGGNFAALKHLAETAVVYWFVYTIFSAALLLVIRWLYQMIRDQEGIGFGDVKLMAMLGGWFCAFRLSLLTLGLGIVFGALVALLLLASPSVRASKERWGLKKLPFGAFLCLGGIVCDLWGQPIIDTYRHWAGF